MRLDESVAMGSGRGVTVRAFSKKLTSGYSQRDAILEDYRRRWDG